MSGSGFSAALEGGKQIDPYLLATKEIQRLQRRVETLLRSEKDFKVAMSSLKERWEKEQTRLEEHEKETMKLLQETTRKAREEEVLKGFEEGFRKGQDEAVEKAEKKLREEFQKRFSVLEERINSITKSMESTVLEEIEHCGPKMVFLWRLMLEKMLKRKVDIDEDVALRIFKAAIFKTGGGKKVRLFLNPVDRDFFLEKGEELAEIRRIAESFEIVSDPGMGKGEFLLETNIGVCDARWDSQFEIIDKNIDHLIGGI